MCGIAGLFSKSGSIEESLGTHLSAMLSQLADRGPDSAGVALYRDPAPAGSCKVSLFSADEPAPWDALASELDEAFGAESEPEVRASHALFVVPAAPADVQGWLAEQHPELRMMSVGERIEIYKEAGRSPRLREAVRARGHLGDARPGPHPHGHREPGDDGAFPPLLDRPRPLPRAQRLALEPQPAAHVPAPPGDRLPDRQRHRGRGRLPDVAPVRG